jgi:hypothetical protein
MKNLENVGFFEELPHGYPHGGSLAAAVGKLGDENIKDIIGYLRAGKLFVVSPGVAIDVLSKDRQLIGTLAIQTDGDWAWPSDLAYYVQTYRVALPPTFVQHMRTRRWVIGPVEIADLSLGDS